MLRNLVVEEYTASARFALQGSESSKLTLCQTYHYQTVLPSPAAGAGSNTSPSYGMYWRGWLRLLPA